MLAARYLGTEQNDLKPLLALFDRFAAGRAGGAHRSARRKLRFKALVISILAHALYKSALFMAAGIIDHETGTRDLRQLGGLRRQMPILFAVTTIAALSMAGLPPLFGFLAEGNPAGNRHPSDSAAHRQYALPAHDRAWPGQ